MTACSSGPSTAVTAAPAAQGTCVPEIPHAGDLDGDGAPDVVVGMPGRAAAVGAVDVRYTGRASQVITPQSFGSAASAGSRFGSALAVGDLDDDGCADLLIGAPGQAPPDATTQATGVVHILFGSPTGLDLTRPVTITHPIHRTGYSDDFGISLAVSHRHNQSGRGRTYDLYVGAPGLTVGGQVGAGGVYRYVLTGAGGEKVTPAELRTQNSRGVPGGAEREDRFGAVLAGDYLGGGVIAAAPGEDIGAARNAGAIWHLRVRDDGTAGAADLISQDSRKVPGTAETGDRFGSALAMQGNILAVGVPGENVGPLKDAGLAQLFMQNSRTFRPRQAITQGSPGIPGAVEAGDRFGAAVAAVFGLRCQKFMDVAIGAPGEDIGTSADAGNITVVPYLPTSDCTVAGLRQGSGLPDVAEAGDEVGSVLGVGYEDPEQTYSNRLLVGVPLEDVGARRDAGVLDSYGGSPLTVNGAAATSLTYSGGYDAASDYGMILSQAFD